MATLNKVIDMQKQGFSDEQIFFQLQNEGISPKEINDSINQAKIKGEIFNDENKNSQWGQSQMHQTQELPEIPEPLQDFQMQQPSQFQTEQQNQENYYQQPQNQEIYPLQQQEQGNYYAPQSSYEQGYYLPQGVQDTETISEIAEQIVSEKIEDLKNQIGDITSFKTTTYDKISDIDERLKRIEDIIDKLQQSIIGKIGEFGESTETIHRDLDNLHGTVAKLMNPLIDNYKELKRISKKE